MPSLIMNHPELFDAKALNALIAGMPSSPEGTKIDGTAATAVAAAAAARLTVDTTIEESDVQEHHSGGDSTGPPFKTTDKRGQREEGSSPRADGKSEKDIRREARVEKYFKLKRRLLRADQCIICLDTNIAPTVALLCCGQAAHVKCLAGWYAADAEQQQQQQRGLESSGGSSSSNKSKCPCPYCRHQLAEPDKPIKMKNMEEAAVSLTSKILARSRRFQDSNSLTENIIAHMTRYDASQRRPNESVADSQETGSMDSGMGGGGSSPALIGCGGGQQISPSSTTGGSGAGGGGGGGGIAGLSPRSSFQIVDGIPYPSNVSVKSSLSRTNSRSDDERSVTGEGNRSSTASPNFFAPPPPPPPPSTGATIITTTTKSSHTSPVIAVGNHSVPRSTSCSSLSSNHSSPTAAGARKMGVAETMIAPNGLPYLNPTGKR